MFLKISMCGRHSSQLVLTWLFARKHSLFTFKAINEQLPINWRVL